MKCDGVRPMCAQCVRADEVECEYTDGGLTASQLLEQNVAHLEARIRELEGRSSESVTLHDPHAAFSQSRHRPHDDSVTGGERADTQSGSWKIPEVLLKAFVDHAFAFGFFLNLPRFLAKLDATEEGDNTFPDVILYAVHLVGLVTSRDRSYKDQESQVLSLLIQSLSSAVSDFHAGQLLHILQAEVLLSNYFLHHDRRLEGGYHITAAVSMVLSSNLHRVQDPSSLAIPGPGSVSLPPPTDSVEQGERINAFWAVYSLDRFWSVKLGAQSALSRADLLASQITTPWPLDMSEYELGMLPDVWAVQTVSSFLGEDPIDLSNDSYATKRAKGIVLFSDAVQLGSHFVPENPGFQAKFLEMDSKLEQYKVSFRATMDQFKSNLEYDNLRPYATRCMLFTQTMAHCATIKLHAPLQQDWDIDTSRSLSNAVQAANLLQELEVTTFEYIDPFMGILWSIVASVLIRALTIARQLRAANNTGQSEQEVLVTNALDRILNVMQALTVSDPSAALIAHELQNIRQHTCIFSSP
ncbi:hypothetical protein EUX98_g840 [Antrodiella citrinella]|uniref:Xylanolytic transcriptional activator regulatory domain-containing protein n=1 Tax=Antrodiella citrinella TaxID=2447956 RepID=A0A4S4N595_9APHY|nr:hypothetical protein EUX98_g840 [Antrodiella citrinella]